MRGNPSFIPPVSQNSDWFTVVARYNTASYPTGRICTSSWIT
jgi:hypothetical protein